ncbi:hypothetical protein EW145_g7142, partial [Phellinidium pouzarii]
MGRGWDSRSSSKTGLTSTSGTVASHVEDVQEPSAHDAPPYLGLLCSHVTKSYSEAINPTRHTEYIQRGESGPPNVQQRRTSTSMSASATQRLHSYSSKSNQRATAHSRTFYSYEINPGLPQYGYIPSELICIIFISLFGISTFIHVVQSCRFRMWWLFPTIILAGFGEIVGWVGRLWSSQTFLAGGADPFLMQIVSTIIAPTPLLAANFIILGMIIRKLGIRYSRLRPRLYSIIFTTTDVTALLVQAVGGAMASGTSSASSSALGGNIMLAGIIIQLVAIIVYSSLAIEFLRHYHQNRPFRQATVGEKRGIYDTKLKRMIAGLTISTVCLFIRAIYRTAELADGWTGPILRTQVYFNVFDGAMIVIAIYTMNVFHPGFIRPISHNKHVWPRKRWKGPRKVSLMHLSCEVGHDLTRKSHFFIPVVADRGGAKRHRKILRDNIQGITKPAIRRLARRGGVKRISALIYEETRGVLKVFLEGVIRDSVTYTEHAKRKTVTALDVVYALKRSGRTLYGFVTMAPRRMMNVSPTRIFNTIYAALIAAIKRLDKSLDPRDSIAKLQRHQYTFSDSIYIFHFCSAIFWVCLWPLILPFKLLLATVFITGLSIPLTSQFLIPAMPILSWIMTFFSSRFIPVAYRPPISVSLLPTLESVLYGANISDILTRFTHPILDIFAWLPYGVLHFILPFVVAIFLWLFRPKEALHYFARAFGYMNLIGVLTQIIIPCAAPWYEVIYGLTPANYSIRGSAGGLMRIDMLFGSSGYQKTFGSSPLVFGAFPSLHAGNATIEALFWSKFFPWMRTAAWAYAGLLYWATMYLTHHYLIDVVGGACLATACFYLFLPTDLRGANATHGPAGGAGGVRTKHELYDLEVPPRGFGLGHVRGQSGKGLRLDADADSDGGESDAVSSAEEQ